MKSMEELTFVNQPRELGERDYRQAESEFLAKYATHPDTLAIYEFGTVTAPGISDLDFIVVMRPQLRVPLTRDYGFDFLSEPSSYILSHNPTLMPPEVFRDYWRIYPLMGLRQVHGEPFMPPEAMPDERELYQALTLIYVSGRQYPTLFLQLLSMPTLDVRLCIQLLNALTHALRLCAGLGGGAAEWAGFSADVTDLKLNWFTLDRACRLQRLVGLLEEATPISVEMLKRVDAFVTARLWCIADGEPQGKARFRETGRYLPDTRLFGVMSHDFDPAPVTLEAARLTYCWWRFLPASYQLPLIEYGKLDGWYSAQVKAGLVGRDPGFTYLHPQARAALQRTGLLHNCLYDFHRDNRISAAVSAMSSDVPSSAPSPERPQSRARWGLRLAGQLRREVNFHNLLRTYQVDSVVRLI